MAHMQRQELGYAILLVLLGTACSSAGCHAVCSDTSGLGSVAHPIVAANAPRELEKAVLPTYVIEPPDILTIEVIQAVPKSPYTIKVLDGISIRVRGTLPDAPIDGTYRVEPGGFVQLGSPYGTVPVAGVKLEDVQGVIEQHLAQSLKDPQVSVSLVDMVAMQQVAGQHLVAPDGTVTLGTYGSIFMVGKTLDQARADIEAYLSQFLDSPKVSVDVFAYNSKVYYVIAQGAGTGDGVFRFPVTGNETVLDALAQINGMGPVSSKKVWIARPGPSGNGCDQVLPVDWNAVTQVGCVSTNYQIMPGDRVYIAQDELVALDTNLGKLFAPFERIFGFTLLGVGTTTRLSGSVLKGGGNARANF